ncbi:MAG TPA: uracil-DNA glycosylase, partial [Longimicrobium sp.]|nr:uracil-DNA glycosylase [Longimicrobium sp.]
PEPGHIFRALELTKPADVRAVIIGQDPYPNPKHAEGLCFSVKPGVKPPVSLRNVFTELHDDVGCPTPADGHLAAWAERGVLLLNAVLTVRADEPNSHKGKGWEVFTDAVIRAVNGRPHRVVFVLWGGYAARKAELIDRDRHVIVQSAHPSPLSAKRGFFGSRPFSQVNAALEQSGQAPVDWCLPDLRG